MNADAQDASQEEQDDYALLMQKLTELYSNMDLPQEEYDAKVLAMSSGDAYLQGIVAGFCLTDRYVQHVGTDEVKRVMTPALRSGLVLAWTLTHMETTTGLDERFEEAVRAADEELKKEN